MPPPLNEQEDDTGVAEVKVAMPFTLKKQLVTDWENVTQEPRRLVRLPRDPTAADVMKQYMDSKANRSTQQQTARAQELMDGVRIYFDKVTPGATVEVLLCCIRIFSRLFVFHQAQQQRAFVVGPASEKMADIVASIGCVLGVQPRIRFH